MIRYCLRLKTCEIRKIPETVVTRKRTNTVRVSQLQKIQKRGNEVKDLSMRKEDSCVRFVCYN